MVISMRFETSHVLPADLDRVMAMLRDRGYLDSSARASGALSWTNEVAGQQDGAFVVRSARHLPTDAVPPSLRQVLGARLEVKMVQAWTPVDVQQSRRATVTIDITGVPARCSGRIVVGTQNPSDHSTTVRQEWDIEVTIPLVGAMVAEKIAETLRNTVDAEHAAALSFLNESSEES